MKILLIGNGELSSREKELIHNLQQDQDYKIAAIDGGLAQVEMLQLKADYHLGDFDSSQAGPQSIVLEDQNLSDLEKSIHYLFLLGFKEFHLFAFHGKRFDHAINNLETTFRLQKTNRFSSTLKILKFMWQKRSFT
jgi:thiamine pyrophosphokinase